MFKAADDCSRGSWESSSGLMSELHKSSKHQMSNVYSKNMHLTVSNSRKYAVCVKQNNDNGNTIHLFPLIVNVQPKKMEVWVWLITQSNHHTDFLKCKVGTSDNIYLTEERNEQIFTFGQLEPVSFLHFCLKTKSILLCLGSLAGSGWPPCTKSWLLFEPFQLAQLSLVPAPSFRDWMKHNIWSHEEVVGLMSGTLAPESRVWFLSLVWFRQQKTLWLRLLFSVTF